MRLITTTYVYDDTDPTRPPARPPGTPPRIVSTIQSPAYTPEDRALLLALDTYESAMCSGCGHPRDRAWHSEMDGWYEAETFVCHGCLAKHGGDDDARVHATYVDVVDTRPSGAAPLPPFVLGVTTTSD